MQTQEKHTQIAFVTTRQELAHVLIKIMREMGLTVTDIICLSKKKGEKNKRKKQYLKQSTIAYLVKQNSEIESLLPLFSEHDLYFVIASGEWIPDSSQVEGYKTLSEVEREYIIKTMKKCNGQCTAASKLLGIDRSTLYRKLKSHRLEKKSIR